MSFRLLFTFFLFLFIGYSKAQVFPYLNASTGNKEQYIIDKDTNLYMYHESQIEKLDKNFNPIWIKSYPDLFFHNLLLSKTGSLYFISKNPSNDNLNVFGKVNPTGSIDWCKIIDTALVIFPDESNKSSMISFYKLILDRNNNLIISGSAQTRLQSYDNVSGLFLKVDTNGNSLTFKNFFFKFSTFSFLDNFTVLDDSLGTYRFIFDFNDFESGNAFFLNYDENNDTVINSKKFTHFGPLSSNKGSMFSKSKINKDFTYAVTEYSDEFSSSSQHNFLISKFYKDMTLWSMKFDFYANARLIIKNIDEDENGDIIFIIKEPRWVYNYTSTCFKINFSDSILTQKILISNVLSPLNQNLYPHEKIHAFPGKKYFYDVYQNSSPPNPLNVNFLDSTLSNNCNGRKTYNTLTNGFSNSNFNYFDVGTINTYNEYFITQASSDVSSFIINPNYCLILNEQELQKNTNSIEIFPNPTNQLLYIKSKTDDVIIHSKIYDIYGNELLIDFNHDMDVSNLNAGIYFIKVKTDKGEFIQKFIKE